MKSHPLPCLIPLLIGLGFDAANAGSPATFLVLEQGVHSGIATERLDTIRDKAALRSLWQEHQTGAPPTSPMPEVDFSKEMVVAAFAGQKNTGGYQLNLTGLDRRGGHIDISLSLTQPGPDCLVAQALTQPYVIVRIPYSNKQVNFRLSAKTFSCVTGNAL